MAQVNLRINGYAYLVGCDDGQERHLEAMGVALERRIDRARAALGPQSEARMLLLGALLLADDLHDQEAALAEAQAALVAAERAAREAAAEAEAARAAAAQMAAALPERAEPGGADDPEFQARVRRLADRAEEIAEALERS
ncbi:cell division protein ZapA [Acidisoma sp. C75]